MLRNNSSLNILLLAAVVVCALSVVTSQHKGRKLFIELQKEKERTQQMEVEWGQLQLEQGTWAAPSRVEKIATRQLQMQSPKNAPIQFIQVEQSSIMPPASLSPLSSGQANKNIDGAGQQP